MSRSAISSFHRPRTASLEDSTRRDGHHLLQVGEAVALQSRLPSGRGSMRCRSCTMSVQELTLAVPEAASNAVNGVAQDCALFLWYGIQLAITVKHLPKYCIPLDYLLLFTVCTLRTKSFTVSSLYRSQYAVERTRGRLDTWPRQAIMATTDDSWHFEPKSTGVSWPQGLSIVDADQPKTRARERHTTTQITYGAPPDSCLITSNASTSIYQEARQPKRRFC